MAEKYHNKTITQMREYSEMELEHIQIECKNNRNYNFRTFIDSYMCFLLGYVSSACNATASKPKSDLFYRKGFMSGKAIETIKKNIENGSKENKNLTKEHVVPISVLTNMIIGKSKDEISEILRKYYIIAIIHEKENKELYENKDETIYCRDPWHRYREVVVEKPLTIIYVNDVFEKVEIKSNRFVPEESEHVTSYKDKHEKSWSEIRR